MATMSILNKDDTYQSMSNIYIENRNKPPLEWLDFVTTFDKPGKQGIVGLLEPKEKEGDKFVFKISQYINHLPNHECTIMRSLNELAPYCPHFCKSFGTVKSMVEPNIKKTKNPFAIKCKYPIEKDILLCEYIDKSYKLYNYIRSEKVEEDILYSAIKQTLMAILMAQNKKNFTHYDLHSDNIMMKKCNKDLVFIYVIDEDIQVCVPTMGAYPKIIDFGFSYVKEMEDAPLYTTLSHTNVGFMSDRFDPFSDAKLFLVTVSAEIKEKRGSSASKKFRRIVRNMFGNLQISWSAGWDNSVENGADEVILEDMEAHTTKESTVFTEFPHYCIDLIQSLIILPLEPHDYSEMEKSYKSFLKEWVKIENEITSPFYSLYILKALVDSARKWRPYYMRNTTQQHAVKEFKSSILDCINTITTFCTPKNVNYEILLCSLLVYSRNLEGRLYDQVGERMAAKQKQYDMLPLQTITQMYAALEVNIPDEYRYNEETTFCILDAVKETTSLYKPSAEEIEELNEMDSLTRGSYVYQLGKKEMCD